MGAIELHLQLPMGHAPPAYHISAATEVLRASEYDGRKAIKLRILRIDQTGNALEYYECVRENLDIVVV